MGHHITGVIARREVLMSLEGPLAGQACYALAEGLAFMPLDGENLDDIAGYDGERLEEFLYLTEGLIRLLCLASRHGDLAYIETYYAGGAGDQGAVVFRGGAVLSAPVRRQRGPINDALRQLGVVVQERRVPGLAGSLLPMGIGRGRSQPDAFTLVGLADYRENEDFREKGTRVRDR